MATSPADPIAAALALGGTARPSSRHDAHDPMRRWFANRALDALAKSLVCFAVLHQVLLAIHVSRHGDFAALNVFTMLEAQRLFSGLDHGPAEIGRAHV